MARGHSTAFIAGKYVCQIDESNVVAVQDSFSTWIMVLQTKEEELVVQQHSNAFVILISATKSWLLLCVKHGGGSRIVPNQLKGNTETTMVEKLTRVNIWKDDRWEILWLDWEFDKKILEKKILKKHACIVAKNPSVHECV